MIISLHLVLRYLQPFYRRDGQAGQGSIYLAAAVGGDAMQAEELDEEGVRVPLHVLMVPGQQLQQQLHLAFLRCLEHGALCGESIHWSEQ